MNKQAGTVSPATAASASVSLTAWDEGQMQPRFDTVAKEEPLQIRVGSGGRLIDVAVTMRTPGNDFELAAGFLYSEGLIRSREQIDLISYCVDAAIDSEQRYNIVTLQLRGQLATSLERLERHFAIGSACGVCGKAQLEDLQARGIARIENESCISADVLRSLPERLQDQQRVFAMTGGLHASALFGMSGALEAIREDVGRHNATDKLIGWGLLSEWLPFGEKVLVVSGRSSFEIVQKAAAAGVPIVCSVSAPSSLAIEVAQTFNITLIGFLRGSRFNVYSGAARIV